MQAVRCYIYLNTFAFDIWGMPYADNFGMPLVFCYAVTALHLIYGNVLCWYALNDFGVVMSR